MHSIPHYPGVARLLACSVFLALSACTTTKRSAEVIASPNSPGAKILTEADYDYVYVTGSIVPIKVPKQAIARPLPAASDVQTMSPEAFQEVVRRGQTSTSKH
jgi:hypothetical protein